MSLMPSSTIAVLGTRHGEHVTVEARQGPRAVNRSQAVETKPVATDARIDHREGAGPCQGQAPGQEVRPAGIAGAPGPLRDRALEAVGDRVAERHERAGPDAGACTSTQREQRPGPARAHRSSCPGRLTACGRRGAAYEPTSLAIGCSVVGPVGAGDTCSRRGRRRPAGAGARDRTRPPRQGESSRSALPPNLTGRSVFATTPAPERRRATVTRSIFRGPVPKRFDSRSRTTRPAR